MAYNDKAKIMFMREKNKLNLGGVISRYLCDKNLHRWKVRHSLMFNAPIDRACKHCNKKQRMNIHLKYVDSNGL